MRWGLLLLSSLVLTCSLWVVATSYEVRMAYGQLQQLRQENNTLATEYGRLMLEVSVMQSLNRVEQVASTELKMHVPAQQELIIWQQR